MIEIDSDKMYTIPEAAACLGFSASTVHRGIRMGVIEAVDTSCRWARRKEFRIVGAAIEEYLRSHSTTKE